MTIENVLRLKTKNYLETLSISYKNDMFEMPSPSEISTNMDDIVMPTATALNQLPYFLLEGHNRD